MGVWEGMKPLRLSERDDGRTLLLTRGQMLELEVVENPTTGYLWQVERDGMPVLQQADSDFVPEAPNRLGEGGRKTFLFEVVEHGQVLLKLRRLRSWSREVDKDFSLRIIVRGKANSA